jgi:hypothetical protein
MSGVRRRRRVSSSKAGVSDSRRALAGSFRTMRDAKNDIRRILTKLREVSPRVSATGLRRAALEFDNAVDAAIIDLQEALHKLSL